MPWPYILLLIWSSGWLLSLALFYSEILPYGRPYPWGKMLQGAFVFLFNWWAYIPIHLKWIKNGRQSKIRRLPFEPPSVPG